MKTKSEGESLLNSIIETWGKEDHPFYFCYLGNANYKYDKLIKILKQKKNKETKTFKENGSTFYNACFNNCQHFSCDIIW